MSLPVAALSGPSVRTGLRLPEGLRVVTASQLVTASQPSLSPSGGAGAEDPRENRTPRAFWSGQRAGQGLEVRARGSWGRGQRALVHLPVAPGFSVPG